MTRRDDSLIGQIVAANVLLFALTLFAASLVAGLDLSVDQPAVAVPGARPRDHPRALREHVDAPAAIRPLERLIDEIEASGSVQPV